MELGCTGTRRSLSSFSDLKRARYKLKIQASTTKSRRFESKLKGVAYRERERGLVARGGRWHARDFEIRTCRPRAMATLSCTCPFGVSGDEYMAIIQRD
jgi:hypothetical protein